MPDQPTTTAAPETWVLVFGYKHVVGVPRCPCGDPGNYLSMERGTADRLRVRFTCWCGRTVEGRMDDQAEMNELLAKNGVLTVIAAGAGTDVPTSGLPAFDHVSDLTPEEANDV